MRCGRTFRLARTHPADARLSGSETLSRSRSLVGYTIDTHESEFSEATSRPYSRMPRCEAWCPIVIDGSKIVMTEQAFMQRAVTLALEKMRANSGGPFGAGHAAQRVWDPHASHHRRFFAEGSLRDRAERSRRDIRRAIRHQVSAGFCLLLRGSAILDRDG